MLEDLRRWLLLSGLTARSLDLLEPDLPRWERRLRSMGVSEVLPPTASRGRLDDRVSSLLCLWTKQAMADENRDHAAEHELRNLTGTRPWRV